MDAWTTEILDLMDDALYAVDEQWCITFVNRAAEELWDRRRDDLLGKNIWEVFPQAVGTDAYHEYLGAMRERRPVKFENLSPVVNRWFHVSAYPIGTGLAVHFSDINERKLIEIERERLLAELDENRRLFRQIAETSPDAIVVYDLDSARTTYVSVRSEHVVGYTAGEVSELGERFAVTLWHPDDAPSLPEHRRKLRTLADGEIYETEYRVRQPDGTYRWLRSRSSVFARAEDGHVRQIVTVSQDITERKHAEERLAYHAHLLENVHDAIVGADERLVVTAWNHAAEGMYGWAADEVLGREICEVVRSEFPEDQRAEGYRILAETGSYHAETVHHRKDGTRFHIEGTITALRDPGGRVSGYIYTYHDITERKRAEEAQRKQQEILQKIFDHIPVMIRFRDVEGRIQLINREYERTLGWSLEELREKNLDIFAEFYPEPQERQRVLNWIAAATGEWGEFKTRPRDGRVIDTAWATIRLSDGTAISIGQDVTERKRAEEALRRARDDLEATVAERTRALEEANAALRMENAERIRAEHSQQVLLHRLITAQEEERGRIAREIHDLLGQYLTALHLGLKSVQAQEGCPLHVRERLQQLRELAWRLDDAVEHLTFELYPPALDALGLPAALALLVKEWSATSHIPVDVHTRRLEHRRLPAIVETTVYRIVQEALTNVVKHAQATRVSLIVERRDDEVLAIVEDDGRGFDLERVTGAPGAQQHLGIRGMQERAALAGGRLEIETAPGAGTSVYLHVPLRSDPAAEGGTADA